MSTNDILLEIESTIDEVIEEAENFKDTVESTTSHARYENDLVINSRENYVPLDNQPYGEELIRTDDIAESVGEILTELELVREEGDISKIIKLLQNAEETIATHQNTFSDCFSDTFIEKSTKEATDDFSYTGSEDYLDEDN